MHIAGNRNTINIFVVVGLTLGVGAVVGCVISLVTNHWIEIRVDRASLGSAFDQQNPNHFSRNRGLFRTCFIDIEEEKFLANAPFTVVDKTCMEEEGFDLDSEDTERSKWGQDYDTRNHLLRTHIAMFAIGGLLAFMAFLVTIFACWRWYARYLLTAGGLMTASAVMIAGGMGCFHGYWDMEQNDLNFKPFAYYYLHDPVLRNATSSKYGWSYFVGWGGATVGLISSALLLMAGWYLQEDKENKHTAYATNAIIKVPPPQPQVQQMQQVPQVPQVQLVPQVPQVQQVPQMQQVQQRPQVIVQRIPVPVPVIQEKPVPVPVDRLVHVPVPVRGPPMDRPVPVPMDPIYNMVPGDYCPGGPPPPGMMMRPPSMMGRRPMMGPPPGPMMHPMDMAYPPNCPPMYVPHSVVSMPNMRPPREHRSRKDHRSHSRKHGSRRQKRY